MSDNHVEKISQTLFTQSRFHVYAVLDGASIPDLLMKLYNEKPDYFCLYRGELEPDMEEIAPYMIRLEPDTSFTNWLLKEGWGQHWGIFAFSKRSPRTIRKHFRSFMIVHDGDGKPFYFRYYDPRVLRRYLPTCNDDDLKIIFGPVDSYFIEAEKAQTLLQFRNNDGTLEQNEIQLTS
jgi:hypothetical protein